MQPIPRLVRPVAGSPTEATFGHTAAAQLALWSHQLDDGLVLAPSTCISGCLGVYPAQDFKKGDIACAVESATGMWTEVVELPLAEAGCGFDLALKCPNPRNILQGKAWELIFKGDEKRFVWPHINSSAHYEDIHGLSANVQLRICGTELSNRFLNLVMLEDCPAFSRELLLDYEVIDKRPKTLQLSASPSKNSAAAVSVAASPSSLASSPSHAQAHSPALVTGSPGLPAPQSQQQEAAGDAKEDLTQGPLTDQALPLEPTSDKNQKISTVDDVTKNGRVMCKFERPPGSALYWHQEAAWLTFAKATNTFPATLVATVLGGEVTPMAPNHLLDYDLSPKSYVW